MSYITHFENIRDLKKEAKIKYFKPCTVRKATSEEIKQYNEIIAKTNPDIKKEKVVYYTFVKDKNLTPTKKEVVQTSTIEKTNKFKMTKELIIGMLDNGKTVDQIIKELGINRENLLRNFRRWGYTKDGLPKSKTDNIKTNVSVNSNDNFNKEYTLMFKRSIDKETIDIYINGLNVGTSFPDHNFFHNFKTLLANALFPWPVKGCKYYFINSDFEVSEMVYGKDLKLDNKNRSVNNFFRYKEDAKDIAYSIRNRLSCAIDSNSAKIVS